MRRRCPFNEATVQRRQYGHLRSADIDQAGGFDYVAAIGELTAVLDSLFDGPHSPAHVGATHTAADVFYEHPAHGGVRLFTRQFWGTRRASVVAAVCVKQHRPALMAIVPVGLGLAWTGPLDESQAEELALSLARRRAGDL